MKLMIVVGTRPQFIKAGVISRALRKHNQKTDSKHVQEILVHTGQHYDHRMSQAFFEEMQLPAPAINLNIHSKLHGEMTGTMICSLEKEMLSYRPDCILVFGDTNSTLAGALAASKLHIPIAHIEAGLRSFNRKMPEEVNRVVVDCISDYLFCPCENAKNQLLKENNGGRIFLSGDVLYDSFLFYKDKAVNPGRKEPFALATIHRAENTDHSERLKGILSALTRSPVPVILPLHPRTRKILDQEKIFPTDNVKMIEPLSYLSMLGHLNRCQFVITDSGGLQKEAYFSGKRCITTRKETEWVELVECGANKLIGVETEEICAAFSWAMNPVSDVKSIYGSGNTGDLIIESLAKLNK